MRTLFQMYRDLFNYQLLQTFGRFGEHSAFPIFSHRANTRKAVAYLAEIFEVNDFKIWRIYWSNVICLDGRKEENSMAQFDFLVLTRCTVQYSLIDVTSKTK